MMKNIVKLVLFFLLSIVTGFHSLQARLWTNVQGQTVKADLIAISPDDSSKVLLKLEKNGKIVSVKIESLSVADKQYIQTQIEASETELDEETVFESPVTADSKENSIKIDGTELVNQATQQAIKDKEKALFLAKFLEEEKFPYALLDVNFVGKPQTIAKGDKIEYSVTWKVSINQKKYNAFIKKFSSELNKIALKKSKFTFLALKDNASGLNVYSMNNLSVYNGNNIMLYLCYSPKNDNQSFNCFVYELPPKCKIPLFFYKKLTPAVLITFFDSQKEIVSLNNTLLKPFRANFPKGKKYGYFETFNLFPSLTGNNLHYSFPLTPASASIIAKSSSNPDTNPLVIAPFCRDNVFMTNRYHILDNNTYTTTITFSADDFSRIKESKISINYNNPDMDAANKQMDAYIENIPVSQ